MVAPVEFDSQLRVSAGHIEDVVSDNQLPRKSGAMISDQPPDRALSVGCVVAQFAGALGHQGRNAGHCEILAAVPAERNPPPTPPFLGGERSGLGWLNDWRRYFGRLLHQSRILMILRSLKQARMIR